MQVQIIEYNPKYKEQFIEFNKDWIIDNFGYLEENDLKTFENIENSLKSGSMIYMAADNDILLSGCMAKKTAGKNGKYANYVQINILNIKEQELKYLRLVLIML